MSASDVEARQLTETEEPELESSRTGTRESAPSTRAVSGVASRAEWIDCDKPTAVHDYEAAYYGPGARLQTVVIPFTGHNLTLSTTAPLTHAAVLAWTRTVVRP